MSLFSYAKPRALGEALRLLKNGTVAIAGGTDLIGLIRNGLATPNALVDLTGIEGLRGWTREKGKGLRIGALTPLSDLETSPQLRKLAPMIVESLRDAATPQLRNMGTVGGNLASGEPLTDLSQIFIALDGRARIAGPNGARTIAVEELFLDFYTTSLADDEILTHVVLPPCRPRSGIEYIRFSSSSVVDKPSVGVAVRLTLEERKDSIENARIVLGCVGPTPVRARKAEALLVAKKLTAELAEQAGSTASKECTPTSDLRGSEQYKRAIVRTLVKRATGKAYERAI